MFSYYFLTSHSGAFAVRRKNRLFVAVVEIVTPPLFAIVAERSDTDPVK
jgi:hypothetical protein